MISKHTRRKAATRVVTRPREEPVAFHDPRPDVILDFVFEDGLFFIEISNFGNAPAVNVKSTFNKKFTGLGGEREMSRLSMFRAIAFLAPGRTIKTFLDTSESYFRRKQPLHIDATITWRDRGGKRFTETFRHDLSIYSDIIILHKRSTSLFAQEPQSSQNNQGG